MTDVQKKQESQRVEAAQLIRCQFSVAASKFRTHGELQDARAAAAESRVTLRDAISGQHGTRRIAHNSMNRSRIVCTNVEGPASKTIDASSANFTKKPALRRANFRIVLMVCVVIYPFAECTGQPVV